MHKTLAVGLIAWFSASAALADPSRPLVDAHIHYSHDTWDVLPPAEAVKVLRQAGLRKAFVSSSSDDGTQMLHKAAPDLIVPVLRPYRTRGEISTWVRDPSIVAHVESGVTDGALNKLFREGADSAPDFDNLLTHIRAY